MDTEVDKYIKKVTPFALIVLILFVALFYKQILNGFFQQDEWYSFGWYVLHKNLDFINTIKFFFAPNIGHYNPLTVAIQHLLFSIWGMDYTKFALVGITLHLAVTLAVYFLAKIVFKEKSLLAFSTALLFGVFASSYQGTAWVVTNIATLSSSLLGLVSTILFLVFLDERKNKYLVWSLIVLILSLLFKEITIGLFPLFFILCLLKTKNKAKQRSIFLIVGFASVYIISRIVMFFAPSATGDKLVTESQSIGDIIYNLVTVPLKSLAQIIISPELIKLVSMDIARLFPIMISGIPGSPEFEAFVVRTIMEYVSLTSALSVIAISLFIVLKRKKDAYKNVILFGLGWGVINSFIFSLAPEGVGVISIVDSRNLYFVSVGISIFVVSLLNFLTKGKTRNFIIFLLPILILNVYWLNNNLSKFVIAGKTRKDILEKVIYFYPKLPQKVVFFTTSDSSYYGLPEGERILPFQSGLGQTLLVWYYPKETFPSSFFENRFLWEIRDQGYKEFGKRGFGYFRDLNLLKKAVKENHLTKDSIFAFSWNGATGEIRDISDKIRQEVKK